MVYSAFRVLMESCGEAVRLLDIYIAALSAFHDARAPILRGIRPSHPEFGNAIRNKEDAHVTLVRARRGYWKHIKEHNCRERENA